jgi:catalase
VLLQLAPSEDFNTPTLTTNQGAPVDDVEHSMTAGDSGERGALAGR